MPADRCKVALEIDGCVQYYSRDAETKNTRTGEWYAQHQFRIDPPHAVMSEAVARIFVQKLRSESKVVRPWIVDVSVPGGRRIDVAEENAPYAEDKRKPMLASLDDVNFYVVRPANTPNGPKWFLKVQVPGIEVQTIFADSELSVLQRAADMNFLQFAEKYAAPEQPQQQVQAPPAARLRPGDRFRS